jgi:general secretion pathway protein A
VHLSNPTLTREEFLEYLAHGFGMVGTAGTSKTALILQLTDLLKMRRARGIPTVLVIDEAQCLPLDILEEIRLLANIETETEKLLSVILAGQPEFATRLETTELRQLKQRIALRCTLAPLDVRETASYIAGRIRIAGGEAARVFTREAVQLIHERSRGIPRTINVLCDNALVTGFAMNEAPVSRATILEVCRDFELHANSAQPVPVPQPLDDSAPSTPTLVPEALSDDTSDEKSADGPSLIAQAGPRRFFS